MFWRATDPVPAWQGWLWLLPVLVAAAVYWPAPWAAMVWDDKIVIGQQLPAFATWRDALWPPADIEQWSPSYYRPVVVLSYMLDRALFGDGTAGPHLSNVFFHVLSTLALFALLRRLLGSRAAGLAGAVAGACLFAVHPIHTESVSWMSGRSDVLATMFLLPAVTLALRWRDTHSLPALAGSGLAVLIAILSKEVAVAAFAIIPAALVLAPPARLAGPAIPARGMRTWAALAAALLAAGIGALALRWSAEVSATGVAPLDWPDSVLPPAQAIAFLAIKSFWPWPQMHFVPPSALPGLAGTVVALGALAGLLGWAGARWQRAGDGLPLLAVIWFGAATAPVVAASILAVAEAPVAERYLYLPSVAAALLFGLVVAAAFARGWRVVTAGTVIAVLLLYSAATVQRGLVWQDDESLWSDAVSKTPDEALPLGELAAVRESRGDPDGALELWLRARKLTSDRKIAGIVDGNIGLSYLRRNDYAAARPYLESAVRQYEAQHNAQRGLGATLYSLTVDIPLSQNSAGQVLSMLQSARTHYEIAVRLNPLAFPARLELALVLARLGDVTGRYGGGEQPATYYAEALGQLEWVFARHPAAGEVPATRGLAERLRSALDRGTK